MSKPTKIIPILFALLVLPMVAPVMAEERPSATAGAPALPGAENSAYRFSEGVSVRLRRSFLEQIRWSAGIEARDQLAESFADRSHTDIWQELVAADGLTTGNVADALTSYWVLNWVTANGAYGQKVDNGPVQQQLRLALAEDPNFQQLNDQARQQMAEGYMLNFLIEHAALNDAVARKDVDTLRTLAAASAARFQQQMGVDLLALAPGPNGFEPKQGGR
ncbi:MAG: hypothetical protein IR164_05645 [Devosia sp.]|uniref:DUF6683 family protein n=1 Tax=unclassified Devosia TaxID=196773 RepID=UPI0019FF8EEF|nr:MULTISPECIES: DUF6683 family protein [unclassified Devosia]MBF0678409.1 hypothetical protein [Devosia sp.]WEJ32329.1 hypothetical protein NYQ88_15715 [Devosia sp. SD17-2]